MKKNALIAILSICAIGIGVFSFFSLKDTKTPESYGVSYSYSTTIIPEKITEGLPVSESYGRAINKDGSITESFGRSYSVGENMSANFGTGEIIKDTGATSYGVSYDTKSVGFSKSYGASRSYNIGKNTSVSEGTKKP